MLLQQLKSKNFWGTRANKFSGHQSMVVTQQQGKSRQKQIEVKIY